MQASGFLRGLFLEGRIIFITLQNTWLFWGNSALAFHPQTQSNSCPFYPPTPTESRRLRVKAVLSSPPHTHTSQQGSIPSWPYGWIIFSLKINSRHRLCPDWISPLVFKAVNPATSPELNYLLENLKWWEEGLRGMSSWQWDSYVAKSPDLKNWARDLSEPQLFILAKSA